MGSNYQVSDEDLNGLGPQQLRTEVIRLRDAIRRHMNEKGHDRCWLDDHDLYAVLPDMDQSELKLPPKCEFLENCERYWQNRQPNPPETYVPKIVKPKDDWYIPVFGVALGTTLLGMLLTNFLLHQFAFDIRDHTLLHLLVISAWLALGVWIGMKGRR